MKPPKRPIDAQDMPWSYIGKDALDKAAERAWHRLRVDGEPPYHLLSSGAQTAVQYAVLDMIGTTVPALLRQRAKEMKANGASVEEVDGLIEFAYELQYDHG